MFKYLKKSRWLIIPIALLVFACSPEHSEHSHSHGRQSKKLTFEEFKKETGLHNFSTRLESQVPSRNHVARTAEGGFELSDFYIDTDLIKKLVINEKATYTFSLIPKEKFTDRFFNLTFYYKEGWQSIINEIKPTPEYMEMLIAGTPIKLEGEVTTVYRSMAGTGCYTVFILVINCQGCEGPCDLCNICATSDSARICNGGGVEMQPYAFAQLPANNGGGGSSSHTNNNNPTTNPQNNDPEVDEDDPDNIHFEPVLDGNLVDNPCDQLQEVGDPEKYNVKSEFDWCKEHVNDAKEVGVQLKKVMQYDESFAFPSHRFENGAESDVEIGIDRDTWATIHTHNPGGHPLFSTTDIFNLRTCYNVARERNKPLVMNFLVTQNGNQKLVYAVKITDFEQFNIRLNALLTQPSYATLTDAEKMEKEKKRIAHAYNNANGQFETAFLTFFKNFGISLYKATSDDMMQWGEVILDNPDNPTTTILNPC